MARVAVTITLPEEMIEAVDFMSKDSGFNRSQQIERLISAAFCADGGEGFYKSTELRGGAKACLEMLRGLVAENSSTNFDLDREWIVRILVNVKPGEVPYGSMLFYSDDATAMPTQDPRSIPGSRVLRRERDKAPNASTLQKGKAKPKGAERRRGDVK